MIVSTLASNVAQVGKAALHHSGRARLHQHVAEGRGLDRPGDHRQPAGVGGELAQQRVLRAAADQVHDVDVAPGQLAASGTVRR